MVVRLSVPIEYELWRRLRDVAEEGKRPGARSSVTEVVRADPHNACGKGD